MQHRQILCRQIYANRTLTVQQYRCQHLEKPDTTSTCQLKICSEWQIRTEWTSVSRIHSFGSVGKGEREQSLRLGCVRVGIQHWESKLFSWML